MPFWATTTTAATIGMELRPFRRDCYLLGLPCLQTEARNWIVASAWWGWTTGDRPTRPRPSLRPCCFERAAFGLHPQPFAVRRAMWLPVHYRGGPYSRGADIPTWHYPSLYGCKGPLPAWLVPKTRMAGAYVRIVRTWHHCGARTGECARRDRAFGAYSRVTAPSVGAGDGGCPKSASAKARLWRASTWSGWRVSSCL